MAPIRPFTVDPILTAIAIGYRNPAHALIADRVLPRIQVLQETFKWTEYPLGEAFSFPETEVGRRGRPNTVEFTGDEQSASVVDHGLDSDIPYSDIQAAEAARAAGTSLIDPEKLASEQLTNLVLLAREVRAAAVIQDAANYAADKKVTLVGTDQFNDLDDSDPIGVIETGMESTLIYRPNTHVMGRAVWNVLKRHPKLINAVKGNLTEEGIITKAQYAELFDIDPERVLIGESYVNTAKKGQNVAISRVWGKSIELLYVDPSKGSPTDPTITFGFTAELGQRLSGSWEDRNIGLQGGKWVRVGERVKELVCAKDVGYRIGAAIA